MKMATAMAVACLSVVGMAAGEDAQAVMRRYELNIPKQSLDTALRDLAQQTGLQIALFSDTIDENAMVGPLLGTQSAEQALKALLAPSGLSYKVVSEGTIAVLNPKDLSPASTPAGKPNKKSFWDRFRLSQAEQSESAARAADPTAGERSSSKEGTGSAIEEIVVTAQKREERLQNVPISLTVLGGSDIERSGARGIDDALNQVGGVNLTETQPGRSTISIRGASAGGPTLTGSSPVGYYLDELPFSFISNAILPDVNGFDLQRVEVLRGPQGTLYGAGSLNGVVRILTNDADLDAFSVRGQVKLGSTKRSEESYNGDVAVNVPLIPGALAIRAVASYADLGGYIDTASTHNFNDSRIENYRFKLNAAPTEDLSLEFGATVSRIHNSGPSGGGEDYITLFSDDQPYNRDYEAYNLIASYRFPQFTIQSSTGYIDLKGDGSVDFLIGGVVPVNLQDELSAKSFTEEVRLTSNFEGPWKLSGGVFYRSIDQYLQQAVPAFFTFPIIFTDESRAGAVFGEVTRSLWGGKLEVTGGLRYFTDSVKTKEKSTLFNGTAGPLVPEVKSDFDAVTWRSVVAYHPVKDKTFYVSAATGFRSGFNQAPTSLVVEPELPPVKADRLYTYETGFKGIAFDGRLLYDTAVYYMNWNGPQENRITALGTTAVVNAGSASGPGVDLSLIAKLASGFSINANVGWNDLQFDKDILQRGAVLYPKGQRMNVSPEVTAGLGAEYETPIGSTALQAFFGADGRYSSRMLTHDVVSGLHTTTESDVIFNARLRAGVEADQWTVTLFADNVTNEKGAVDPGTLSDPARQRLRPRTVGMQFAFRFQ